MEQKHLTLEDLRAAAAKPLIESVPCQELGGLVRLRAPTSRDLDNWERQQFEVGEAGKAKGKANEDLRDFRARFLQPLICGEDGQPLFGPGDLDVLASLPGATMSRLYEVARRLAGLDEKAQKAALGN